MHNPHLDDDGSNKPLLSFEEEERRRVAQLWLTARVDWKVEGDGWMVELRTNGLGPDPKVFEQISWAFGDLTMLLEAAAVRARKFEEDDANAQALIEAWDLIQRHPPAQP